jgi:hypothetical protein
MYLIHRKWIELLRVMSFQHVFLLIVYLQLLFMGNHDNWTICLRKASYFFCLETKYDYAKCNPSRKGDPELPFAKYQSSRNDSTQASSTVVHARK